MPRSPAVPPGPRRGTSSPESGLGVLRASDSGAVAEVCVERCGDESIPEMNERSTEGRPTDGLNDSMSPSRVSRRRGTKRSHFTVPFSESDLTPTAMKLLEAARSVFERGGVRALSYEAIGREAELSPSLIRYHFGSKGELLVALAAWLVYRDVHEDAWRAMADRPERVEAIERLLGDARSVLTDPQSYELFFELLPTMLRDEKTRARLADLFRGAIEPRSAALRSDSASEGEAAQARLVTSMTLALADGLAIQLLADPGSVDVEAALRFWKACMSAGLGDGGETSTTAHGSGVA